MPIVWAMFGVILLDLFDRFERRYAVDLDFNEPIGARWITWGMIGERYGWARYFARRYLAIKLPSYSWEYNIQVDDYAMGQWMLLWISDRGWRCVFVFP